MAIDIFNIQPSVVDRSLSGKTILLAGAPKILGFQSVMIEMESSKNLEGCKMLIRTEVRN